tara:strand:+ start:346 stop:585 length:240 start_codon:yes stop_codon:yes gene_type:complete
MKFGKRLDTLERNTHVPEYIPPTIIHTIVEPSESGPKEIGVFANVFVEGVYKRIDLELGKTQEKYEMERKNIRSKFTSG